MVSLWCRLKFITNILLWTIFFFLLLLCIYIFSYHEYSLLLFIILFIIIYFFYLISFAHISTHYPKMHKHPQSYSSIKLISSCDHYCFNNAIIYIYIYQPLPTPRPTSGLPEVFRETLKAEKIYDLQFDRSLISSLRSKNDATDKLYTINRWTITS